MAALQDDFRRAARLVGAAATLREAIGAPLAPTEEAKLDNMIASAKEALGLLDWERMTDEGRALPLEQALTYALTNNLPEYA
jgi:hypothetical protein